MQKQQQLLFNKTEDPEKYGIPYALHDLHIYRCSKVGLGDNLQYYNSLQLIYSYTQASLNFFKLLQISSKFFKLPLTASCCCRVCFEFCFLVANVDHSKLQIISSTQTSPISMHLTTSAEEYDSANNASSINSNALSSLHSCHA